MFEQAAIAVQDEQSYAQLHALIDAAFDARDVEVFLNRVMRSKLRIRDYESVLKRGFLGKEAVALVRGASGFRPGFDARALSAAGGSGAGRSAAEVFQGLRVLLRKAEGWF